MANSHCLIGCSDRHSSRRHSTCSVAANVATLPTKDIENHKAELSKDLENHKSELAKSQAEHMAGLAPQLEKIKHDFERELAAYKVSLIAEAEAAKAKAELKKSIALRYSEIEFERLVELEHLFWPMVSDVLTAACLDMKYKTSELAVKIYDQLNQLRVARERAEMYISLDHRVEFNGVSEKLREVVCDYVGPEKPLLPSIQGLKLSAWHQK